MNARAKSTVPHRGAPRNPLYPAGMVPPTDQPYSPTSFGTLRSSSPVPHSSGGGHAHGHAHPTAFKPHLTDAAGLPLSLADIVNTARMQTTEVRKTFLGVPVKFAGMPKQELISTALELTRLQLEKMEDQERIRNEIKVLERIARDRGLV